MRTFICPKCGITEDGDRSIFPRYCLKCDAEMEMDPLPELPFDIFDVAKSLERAKATLETRIEQGHIERLGYRMVRG